MNTENPDLKPTAHLVNRYFNDTHFNHLVNQLCIAMKLGKFTSSDLEDALYLAKVKYEQEKK